MFQGCVKGVSRMFQGCLMIFKGASRMGQKCYKEVSRKLSRCLKKDSCYMELIAASRAEGGLVWSIIIPYPTDNIGDHTDDIGPNWTIWTNIKYTVKCT